MKKYSSYVREMLPAIKYYISVNDIDDTVQKIGEYIQNIQNLSDSEKQELDLFVADYTVDNLHLANITYINNSGDVALKYALSRIEPYIVCDPKKCNHNFYEARGNDLHALKNNKSVKVIKRTYPKKAA